MALRSAHAHHTDWKKTQIRARLSSAAVRGRSEVVTPDGRYHHLDFVVVRQIGVDRLIGLNHARVGDNQDSSSHASIVADSNDHTRPATIKG